MDICDMDILVLIFSSQNNFEPTVISVNAVFTRYLVYRDIFICGDIL